MTPLISQQRISPGRFPETLTQSLLKARETRLLPNLWERALDLWNPAPDHQAVAQRRLGWLDAVAFIRAQRAELTDWADRARENVRDLVLLGMGGSSLGPDVIARIAAPSTAPRWTMLDSTDPASVRATAERIDPATTLFIVASKSGSTLETRSHLAYFYDVMAKARLDPGRAFVAVTDAESSLHGVADRRRFLKVFLNPSDIGGRYSVLSFFGLVPAALMGVDLSVVADRIETMATACRADAPVDANPAALLGLLLGTAATGGADVVTLLTSPALRPFGAWVEQLVAESTGKEGKGIIPVDGEPLRDPTAYGRERCVVALTLDHDPDPTLDRLLGALRQTGTPLVEIALPDRAAVFGEFLKWELATALAATVLRVDPFDEPNVQESKDKTQAILQQFEQDGRMPQGNATVASDRLAVWGRAGRSTNVASALAEFFKDVRPPLYLAILAFLDRGPLADDAITALRQTLGQQLGVPTLFGYGPRYLHSIGQLYKGGPPRGAFLILTTDPVPDLPIPDARYTFGQLQTAQALGDFEALREHERPVIRVHLSGRLDSSLEALAQAVTAALSPAAHG